MSSYDDVPAWESMDTTVTQNYPQGPIDVIPTFVPNTPSRHGTTSLPKTEAHPTLTNWRTTKSGHIKGNVSGYPHYKDGTRIIVTPASTEPNQYFIIGDLLITLGNPNFRLERTESGRRVLNFDRAKLKEKAAVNHAKTKAEARATLVPATTSNSALVGLTEVNATAKAKDVHTYSGTLENINTAVTTTNEAHPTTSPTASRGNATLNTKNDNSYRTTTPPTSKGGASFGSYPTTTPTTSRGVATFGTFPMTTPSTSRGEATFGTFTMTSPPASGANENTNTAYRTDLPTGRGNDEEITGPSPDFAQRINLQFFDK